jgi:hypothetical protein
MSIYVLVFYFQAAKCRWFGAEDETSTHILCEYEALASLQTRVSGLLLLGARGQQEYKAGGHLEL